MKETISDLPFSWITPGRCKEKDTFYPVTLYWWETGEHEDLTIEQWENIKRKYKFHSAPYYNGKDREGFVHINQIRVV